MPQYFLHPNALCESKNIGLGTRIWAFAHVLPEAVIGANCNICDGVFIENNVVIGDRVTIKCGVQVWDGITLENDVFIGPNATFTNDKFPRSGQHLSEYPKTLVGRGASIGANATILPGIEIGTGAMIGAGAVVTRSVPPNAIVRGNPARICGYVGTKDLAAPAVARAPGLLPGKNDIGIDGCAIYRIHTVRDMRGDLSVGEFERELPFVPKRYFTVFNVPSQEVRGEHAHRRCHQFLTCIHGSCTLLLDDGKKRREIELNSMEIGVHIPPMIWGTQYRYTKDAVLLVFASEFYDPADYIRTYYEYVDAITSASSS